jgi:hypothetical protein
VVRLLAGDLVDPSAIAEGLRAIEPQIDDLRAQLDANRAGWDGVDHRRDLLGVNADYAVRLLELQREWLRDAERVLRHRGAKP